MEINVLQNSKLNIVCPNPATVLDNQDSSIPQEQMYENMWIVDKHEFDTCTVNTSVQSFSTNKKILSCNTPLQLKYYPLVFRAFSAPGGLEFASGTKYYFIGKFWFTLLTTPALNVHVFIMVSVLVLLIAKAQVPPPPPPP